MRAYEVLNEAQLSKDALKTIDGFIEPNAPEISNWFRKKLVRFLSKGHDCLYVVPLKARRAFEPWEKDLQAKGELYDLNTYLAADILRSISLIDDYFNHLRQNDPREYAKIDRMSWEQADQAQKRWHDALKKKAGKTISTATPGQETVLEVAPYRWVKLTSEAALKAEGECMGHCVGGYGSRVTSGEVEIYSLRDAKNQAHITVEIQRPRWDRNPGGIGNVEQVKAKGNDGCPDKYVPYVLSLMKKFPNIGWGSNGVSDMTRNSTYLYDVETKQFGKIEELVEKQELDGISLWYHPTRFQITVLATKNNKRVTARVTVEHTRHTHQDESKSLYLDADDLNIQPLDLESFRMAEKVVQFIETTENKRLQSNRALDEHARTLRLHTFKFNGNHVYYTDEEALERAHEIVKEAEKIFKNGPKPSPTVGWKFGENLSFACEHLKSSGMSTDEIVAMLKKALPPIPEQHQSLITKDSTLIPVGFFIHDLENGATPEEMIITYNPTQAVVDIFGVEEWR